LHITYSLPVKELLFVVPNNKYPASFMIEGQIEFVAPYEDPALALEGEEAWKHYFHNGFISSWIELQDAVAVDLHACEVAYRERMPALENGDLLLVDKMMYAN
jgi:hypothetical protein